MQQQFLLPEVLATATYSIKSGARDLTIAIIQDAFVRLLHLNSGTLTQRRLAKEAKDWFLSTSEGWPFSFRNLCHLLNISPSLVLICARNRMEGKEKSSYRKKIDQKGDLRALR